MTWQSDAVNAFIGIADLIRRGTNTKFWHAMPEFALTRSLLWYPKEPLSRRRSPDAKILFPSWSWAAWQGHVTYRGRGFHNAICYAPTSMIMWLKSATVEEFMETFVQVERAQEEIDERRRQAETSRLLLHKTDLWSLLHIDCYEHGWAVERNEDRNQHLFVHDAYHGMKFEYPINLPDQSIVELPFEDTLYFRAKAVSVRLCDKPSESYLASPIQDNFVQIGVNVEASSSSEVKSSIVAKASSSSVAGRQNTGTTSCSTLGAMTDRTGIVAGAIALIYGLKLKKKEKLDQEREQKTTRDRRW